MRAFFITNRENASKGQYFGPGFQSRPDSFRSGWMDFDPGDLDQDLPESTHVHVAPERQTFDQETQRFRFTQVGSREVFPELMEALRPPVSDDGAGDNKRVGGMVFIPGFNYSFVESVSRAAHLAHLYSTPELTLVPLVFSWPSDGRLSPSAYISDRRDAENSGYAIARSFALFLEILRKVRTTHQCVAPLHLLAHSQGVYALRHAVVALSRPDFPRWPTSIFDSAILAAGDEDRDALERPDKLGPIARLANRIDVYVNQNDKPVRIGDDFDGGTDRIGAYGPMDPSIVERFEKPLSIIDCRDVDSWHRDLTRHQYFRVSPIVVEDIKDVFAGVDPANARHRSGAYVAESYRYHLTS